MRIGELIQCVECGSICVKSDGDLVEPLSHPDTPSDESYFFQWWECMDCGHQWRFQDQSMNPESEGDR